MNDLKEFSPVLCGTFPIQVDIEGSDLDVIMHVKDEHAFECKVKNLYGEMQQFVIKKTIIRETGSTKVNFLFEGFEFELFGQPQEVEQQHAYLHLITEHEILKRNPYLRERVIGLKQMGYKTEPAFCKVLGLEVEDPYLELLHYGRAKGYIE
ncbi:DUF4269 domain-containing protein [Bacillus sp. AK128]